MLMTLRSTECSDEALDTSVVVQGHLILNIVVSLVIKVVLVIRTSKSPTMAPWRTMALGVSQEK